MNSARYGDPLFREIQYFRQAWIWLLLVACGLLCGVFWYYSHPGHSAGGGLRFADSPESAWALSLGLGIQTIVWGLVMLVMYKTNLNTEVRSDGLYIRFFPFHWSFRRVDEGAESYEVQTYRPIMDYGGWGLRWGPKGRAYNVSGNRGVLIRFKTKKRTLMIGSQRPEELLGAIQSIRS